MKFSKRAGREVPVYRIVWEEYSNEWFWDAELDATFVRMGRLLGVCYRVK